MAHKDYSHYREFFKEAHVYTDENGYSYDIKANELEGGIWYIDMYIDWRGRIVYGAGGYLCAYFNNNGYPVDTPENEKEIQGLDRVLEHFNI